MRVQYHLVFIIVTSFLILSKSSIHAQDLNYTHYTVESGLHLPSNEVYGIVFDKNDVLWAATDRGVWRYDGYTSRQFTVTDGLKENINLRIFSDSQGIIWVSSMNNYLFQIIGDSVRIHPMSDSIHEVETSSGFIQQISPNADSSFFLCFNRPGLLLFKESEKPVKQVEHRIGHGKATLAIHYDPDSFYWDMLHYPEENENLRTTVSTEHGWIYLTCGLVNLKNNFRKELSPIGKNEFLFSYSNKVFHIKDGKLIGERTFLNEIIDVYADKKGNFWIGLEKEGALRFPSGDLQSAPVRYLQGESITTITQDHEGNYWFSTANNGIFQANTLDISVYRIASAEDKDNIITAMASDGVNVYLGTQTGRLFKLTDLVNQNYQLKEIKLPYVDGAIRKLFFTPENHLIVFNGNLTEIDTLGRYRGIGRITGYPYDYIRNPDGEWMVSFTEAIMVVRNGRVTSWLDKKIFEPALPNQDKQLEAMTRIRCMFMDSSGRFWMGSQSSGLFSRQDSVTYSWLEKDKLFGKRTHDIVQAGDNIWVSIADYGIAVIHPDSTFIRITQKDQLSSDIIDVLFVENESVVWAGTNNGLNRISLQPGSQKPDSIAYYTISEGLPSNRIYQIIKHKNNIWIGTTQGVIRLNAEFIQPLKIPPRLEPGPLLVNDKEKELAPTLILGPDDKNLVFRYRAITYRKPHRLNYQYRLIGIDKDYIFTNNLESRYPDLNYGSYTYCINASYTNAFDPANEQRFSLLIKRHWYETKVMLVVYLLFLTGLIFVIFRMILKATKQREMEKRQLLNAEKRSLLSQMNPHFIFNSLNSIQHFIIQHDEFQANNYLTNFSGLIRKILDNSKKNLIPLNEEITTLSLYLGMEKLRFENDFEYQINKDSLIDYNETLIPPMFLQPFVENAIWHGLLPMKTYGNLTISFIHQNEYFQCRIEDNGIGREKASTLKGKKPSHVSTGIRNVEERIDLLNKINNKKIILQICDLRQPDGTASGTLVEIFLPFDLKL